MNGNRARLAASLTTLLIALLSGWGVWDLHPDIEGDVRLWLDHTIDLLLMIGYHLAERQVDQWATRLLVGDPAPREPRDAAGTTNVGETGQ